MTDRQLKLIEYLSGKEGYVKQSDIAKAIPEYGSYKADYHNTTARINMTDDIREINNGTEFAGLILSDRSGVKIASRSDCERKLNAEYISVLKAFKRVRQKFAKLNLDSQGFITDDMKQDFKEVFMEE